MSSSQEPASSPAVETSRSRSAPHSLSRDISPPPKRRRVAAAEDEVNQAPEQAEPSEAAKRVINSPFQLTAIKDLSKDANVDAVTLKDILGDPLISECWEFNYLHDISFLKSHFDEDVRDLVQIHVIHGFWKSEDPSRLELMVSGSSSHLSFISQAVVTLSDATASSPCAFMLATLGVSLDIFISYFCR
jgi:hypothetical protein